jgi:hypothetical protein
MIRLQIQLFGPYFSSFSTNSYGYYSQTSQNLVSNFRIFASARIVRQPPRRYSRQDDCQNMLDPVCDQTFLCLAEKEK